MPPIMTKASFTGRVAELLTARDRDAGLEKYDVERVALTFDGVPGDFHGGRNRKSDIRTIQLYKRNADIANVRQVTILSQEELAEVASTLGIGSLPAGWLGANMVLAGVPDLTQLPPSTRLQFPSGACVVVDMENFPCRQVAEVIAKTYPKEAERFVAVANHKRGVTGWVEREGDVLVGDAVTVWFPPHHDYRHR